MAAKLSAHDVEQPLELLDEILSSLGARIVDEHGHEVTLTERLAEVVRAAVAAASGGEALLLGEDETMSPAEAAQLLGVSRPMAYRYIEQRLLETDQSTPTTASRPRRPAASPTSGAAQRAAQLLEQDPDHPRVVAARQRVRARRAVREAGPRRSRPLAKSHGSCGSPAAPSTTSAPDRHGGIPAMCRPCAAPRPTPGSLTTSCRSGSIAPMHLPSRCRPTPSRRTGRGAARTGTRTA